MQESQLIESSRIWKMTGKNGEDICCEKSFHLLKTNLWIEYKKKKVKIEFLKISIYL